jgi:hypothetical protein
MNVQYAIEYRVQKTPQSDITELESILAKTLNASEVRKEKGKEIKKKEIKRNKKKTNKQKKNVVIEYRVQKTPQFRYY